MVDVFNEFKTKLENTGLSENEIGVYISLIKIGESTSGKILNDYKMSAGKIYIVLEKLIKKGLVSYIIKNNVKHFKAHNPKNILDYLGRERKEIELKEKEIETLLPKIFQIIKTPKEDTCVEIYNGLEGFKTIFNRYICELEVGETEYCFDNLEFGAGGKMPDSFKFLGIEYVKMLKKKKIKDKWLISTTNPRIINDMKNIYTRIGAEAEFRYVKDQRFASILCAGKYTILFDYIKIQAILITSIDITESFIKMHKAMWPLGKEI